MYQFEVLLTFIWLPPNNVIWWNGNSLLYLNCSDNLISFFFWVGSIVCTSSSRVLSFVVIIVGGNWCGKWLGASELLAVSAWPIPWGKTGCWGNPVEKPGSSMLPNRLLNSLSLTAVGLSLGCETWLPFGWYHPMVIGWYEYRLGLPQLQWIVGSL